MTFLKHRIADPRMLRLLKKWLRAGVSEDGEWFRTKATLRTELDSVAGHFPELTPKVADFQSLVDEMEHASMDVKSMDACDDIPFFF